MKQVRRVLLVSLFITGAATWRFFELGSESGAFIFSWKWNTIFILGIGLVLAGLALWDVLTTGLRAGPDEKLPWNLPQMVNLRPVLALIMPLALVAFSWLTLGPASERFEDFFLRGFVFWVLSLVVAGCLRGLNWTKSWRSSLALGSLSLAVVHRLALYLPDITSYPFTLGYSEASRYYYASLWFARRLYGQSLPLSPLHPTRYLLQSIPFLLGQLPIWAHRLWQVLLWIGLTGITSFLLGWRVGRARGVSLLITASWTFLFLLQGPVYYHLQVALILVLLSYDRRRPGRMWAGLAVASIWAGLSRVNWIPVPALVAAMLYFLEAEPEDDAAFPWRYLRLPASWGVAGTLLGFLAQAAYAILAVDDPALAASSFSSPLLWYRLHPSPTFPLGVLPGILILTGPLLILIGRALWIAGRSLHLIRLLGFGGILGALFAGGLVVSTKIGGGGNLHNMDAYMVLGVVLAMGIFSGSMGSSNRQALPYRPSWLLLAATMAIPVAFTIGEGKAWRHPPAEKAARNLSRLREVVAEAVGAGEEVLFLQERHLLALGTIDGVPLVPEYEKVLLVEAGMSGNRTYLQGFFMDLESRRFGLIVAPPLHDVIQDQTSPSWEENNIWVENVVRPVLANYMVIEKLSPAGLWLLEPDGGGE